MRAKVGTIQQNNKVIDRVNLRAEAKRSTHRRCKVLIQCHFLKRGWGISLIKAGKDVRQVQNLGQARFLKKPRFCFAHVPVYASVQFPHLSVMILHCDITNGIKGLHPILTTNFTQDY